MASHNQVIIKVNAFVDEGIAPLVLALNSIDGVITFDSCERGVSGEAYVYFTYGRSWRDLGKLLENTAAILRNLDLCCGFSVALEWFGSNEQPRALLTLRPEHVADVATRLSDELPAVSLS